VRCGLTRRRRSRTGRMVDSGGWMLASPECSPRRVLPGLGATLVISDLSEGKPPMTRHHPTRTSAVGYYYRDRMAQPGRPSQPRRTSS
jgi:hypothetical protein